MGGSSKKQTVGYKYYIGMHMILCHGPVDRLMRIRVDEKTAWHGDRSGSGPVKISAEKLFGGESREGGISGTVDFEVGGPTQGKNSYLVSKLGNDVPSFRGVVGAVLRQVYVGLNPYLKKWDFRLSRIHVRQNGIPQWYDEKAEIPIFNFNISSDEIWKYKVVDPAPGSTPEQIIGFPEEYKRVDFDHSSWPEGRGPFGSHRSNTHVASVCQRSIWLRRNIVFEDLSFGSDVYVTITHDDGAWLWWNGEEIKFEYKWSEVISGLGVSTAVIPRSKVKRDNVLAVQVVNCIPYGSDSAFTAGVSVGIEKMSSMNPAHIIRECLTDPDWGMGYAETDIDDASFRAAANVLFEEGMGICLLWDRQIPIEDFIKEIIKHIDAVLYVDRITGKFVLKLIRGDYNTEDLLLLNEDNIVKLEGFQRTAFGELTNSVTVNYWDSQTGNDASLTVQDIALAQMQGAVINTTVQYPGFIHSSVASRVAQRDLKSLSTPLITCTIYANQDAKDLNIGDVFLLSWDDYELDPTPMRVNSIAYGDGKKNQIKITAVQDVFALPTTAVVSPSPLPPVQSITPVPVSTRQVFEVPYLELVQVRGQTEIDNILAADPLAGFVGAAAVRPLSGAINARMLVDAGAGYEEIGALEFAPGAKLASSIGRTETTLPIQDGVDLDQVVLGTWLQCDSEIMAVTALSDTSITVKRGCLDTVPAPHAAGAALVFWDNYAQGDERQYASGETVRVKLQTVTGEGELPAEQAPEDVVTMSARAARPYPPGAVRINSQWFPEVIRGTEALSLSWAHRDRKQQTGQNLIGFTDGSIGPEPGTTYTLRLYGETGSLLRTETGLTGTGYVWSGEEGDSNLAIPGIVGIDAYSTALLGFNPTALYLIEEESGTSMIDTSGNAQHGSYIGGALPDSHSLITEGSKSIYITSSKYATAPGEVMNALNGFSIVLWLQFTHGNNMVICERNGNTGHSIQSGGLPSTIPSGRIAAVSIYGNVVPYLISSISINDGNPHCVVIVFGSSVGSSYIFIDGVDRTTRPYSSISPSYGSSTVWHIGSRAGMANTGFDGRVDGIAFIPSLLTQADAAAINAAGRYSLYRLNGTIRLELESTRDGLTSHQRHNVSVDRAGYGYNYGKYYGGI